MTEATIRTKVGMASLKDMPVLRDGPLPGGFAPVRFARRISNKGLSAMAIYLAAFGAFSWGMHRVGQRINTRRALEDESYAAACFILPGLEAGENERVEKYIEYETEVMKDVSG